MKKLSTKNWFSDAIWFAFSCDCQPYDFKIDHGNRFLSKIPRPTFFPISKNNVGGRDIRHFVENSDFLPVFTDFFRGVAQELLESSRVRGVQKVFKIFVVPLDVGITSVAEILLIRFLSEVIAKKTNWTF